MSDDVDRRVELLRHVERLEAIFADTIVDCDTCGEVVHRPAKVSAAETAAVLRERRATLLELAGIGTVTEDEEVTDDAAARRRDKIRESNTDSSAPSVRRRQPRRSSGRNRGS